jgi:hypothetical protein
MAEHPVIEATPEPALTPVPPSPAKKSGVMARVVRGIILGAVSAGIFGVVLGMGMALLLGARTFDDFLQWALHEALQFSAFGALLGGTLALIFGGLLQRKKVRES